MTDERISPAEYLVRERAAEYRSEYRDGRMVAMTGASSGGGRRARKGARSGIGVSDARF